MKITPPPFQYSLNHMPYTIIEPTETDEAYASTKPQPIRIPPVPLTVDREKLKDCLYRYLSGFDETYTVYDNCSLKRYPQSYHTNGTSHQFTITSDKPQKPYKEGDDPEYLKEHLVTHVAIHGVTRETDGDPHLRVKIRETPTGCVIYKIVRENDLNYGWDYLTSVDLTS